MSAVHNPGCIICSLPIDTASGDFWHSFTDLKVPGRGPGLDLTRTYNALNATTNGIFGNGWSSSYDMHLTVNGDGSVTVTAEDGSQVAATAAGGGTFTVPSWADSSLTENGDGSYTFVRHQTETFVFSSTGQLQSISDPNGYTTTLTYSGGQLTSVTDSAGRSLTLSWGADGHVSKVTDPQGRTVTYTYDGAGDLTGFTDVDGHSWSFTYDANHLMLSMTDPRGGTVDNTYDAESRIATQTDPAGRTTTYAYSGDNFSASGGTTTIIDPRGVSEVQDYTNGTLVSTTKAAGTASAATWRFSYDPATLGTASTTDPDGQTTTATFDADGNQLSSTDALGRTTTYTYNGLDEQTSVTNPQGVTTTSAYDGNGNLLTKSTPLVGSDPAMAQTTTYTYGDAGHPGDVTAMTDPDGHANTYTYDANGDLASVTDPDGHTTAYVYDAIGRRTQMTSPAGHSTSYTYDSAGNLLTTTDPLGHTTTNTYDADGNLSAVTDPEGNTTTYAYDADNELTTTTQADRTTLTNAYDADGNKVSATDASGHTTTYTFNFLNQEITSTDPLGHVTSYTYDPVGNQIGLADPSGRTTTTTYDADNEPTGVTYSDGTTPDVTYAYDTLGRRVRMTDGSGTSTYSYDSLGRLTSTTDGSGATVAYSYDLDGNPTAITYPGGQIVHRTYDAAGQLTTVNDWLGHTTAYTYDADGNPTTQANGNDTTATNTYDAADQLNGITDANTGGPTATYAYTRNADGLVTADTETGQGALSQTYSYNSVNELTGADGHSLTYDPSGNLTTTESGATQTYNNADELTSQSGGAGTTSYGYNPEGERTSTAVPGQPVTGYSYNQAGELTNIASYPPPVVEQISPSYGPPAGGSRVTITGSGFTGATSVDFGGSSASFIVDSDTTITATAPAGGGTVDITVTTPGGTSAGGSADQFTYQGAGAFGSLSPARVLDTRHGTGAAGPVGAGRSIAVQVTGVGGVPASGVGAVVLNVTVTQPSSSGYLTVYPDGSARQTTSNLNFSPGETVPNLVVVPVGSDGKIDIYNGSSGTVQILGDVSGYYLSGTPGLDPSAIAGSLHAFSTDQLTQTRQSSASVTQVASYAYNGDGLRTSKTVSGITDSFVWDTVGSLPLLVQESTPSSTTNYVYGLGSAPIEQITGSSVLWLATDQLGSVRQLTDGSGAVVGTTAFDAYGNVASETGSATSPFRYAGGYRDAESGIYYMSARYYDAGTGEFISVDPLASLTDQPYGYGMNDPVNQVDPLGLDGQPVQNTNWVERKWDNGTEWVQQEWKQAKDWTYQEWEDLFGVLAGHGLLPSQLYDRAAKWCTPEHKEAVAKALFHKIYEWVADHVGMGPELQAFELAKPYVDRGSKYIQNGGIGSEGNNALKTYSENNPPPPPALPNQP
ncbi:MAG: RHS repeat-associated core domain-containing protein [Acidimicrobiales bacterium]